MSSRSPSTVWALSPISSIDIHRCSLRDLTRETIAGARKAAYPAKGSNSNAEPVTLWVPSPARILVSNDASRPGHSGCAPFRDHRSTYGPYGAQCYPSGRATYCGAPPRSEHSALNYRPDGRQPRNLLREVTDFCQILDGLPALRWPDRKSENCRWRPIPMNPLSRRKKRTLDLARDVDCSLRHAK